MSDTETSTLKELASKQFSGFTDAENKLLEAAPLGECAYCGPANKGPEAPENDPAQAATWGKKREIRADLIRWLCINRETSNRIDSMGIQVAAAEISGTLNLSCVNVQFPLRFICCRFLEDMAFNEAVLRGLCLDHSWTKAVSADSVRVAGNVYLRNGFRTEGTVHIRGGDIAGNLECDNASLENPTGLALNANDAKVHGAVLLRNGFRAKGEVNLVNAEIGHLDCTNGSFSAPSSALNADSASLRSSVLLQDGFCARGMVRFVRAKIGADLSLTGANLAETHFLAQRADIGGGLFCQKMQIGSRTMIDLSGASAGAFDDDPESWPEPGNL